MRKRLAREVSFSRELAPSVHNFGPAFFELLHYAKLTESPSSAPDRSLSDVFDPGDRAPVADEARRNTVSFRR